MSDKIKRNKFVHDPKNMSTRDSRGRCRGCRHAEVFYSEQMGMCVYQLGDNELCAHRCERKSAGIRK